MLDNDANTKLSPLSYKPDNILELSHLVENTNKGELTVKQYREELTKLIKINSSYPLHNIKIGY